MPKLPMKNDAGYDAQAGSKALPAPAPVKTKSYEDMYINLVARAREEGRVVVDNEGGGDCYLLSVVDAIVSTPTTGPEWIRQNFDEDTIRRHLGHRGDLGDDDLQDAVRSNRSLRKWLNLEVHFLLKLLLFFKSLSHPRHALLHSGARPGGPVHDGSPGSLFRLLR